jgi:hypothetical protein
LLFRWFIGLAMDDAVWVPTVFSKNRERLIAHDAVIELFNVILATAEKNDWLLGEHFSVDGTLIQAWAGHKSFVLGTRNFCGRRERGCKRWPRSLRRHGWIPTIWRYLHQDDCPRLVKPPTNTNPTLKERLALAAV